MLHEAIHKKTTLAATLCFNSHAWRTNVALLCHLPNQYFHSKLDVSITKKTSSFTIYVNDQLSLWTNFQKSCNAVHQVKHWHFFFFFFFPLKGSQLKVIMEQNELPVDKQNWLSFQPFERYHEWWALGYKKFLKNE